MNLEQQQIYYWAHMLDESIDQSYGLGDRSYYAVWQQTYPEYSDTDKTKKHIVSLFDDYIAKNVPDLCSKLKTYCKVYEKAPDKILPYDRTAAAIFAAFGSEGLTDRQVFWQPISANVYKAMISRHRDVSLGKLTHGVSPNTLKDCLDTICRSVTIVAAIATGMDDALRQSKTYAFAIRKCKLDSELVMTAISDMFLAFSSFNTVENDKAFQRVYDDLYAKYKDEDKDDVLDNHFDEFQDAMDAAIRKFGAGQWLCNDSDGGFELDCIQDLENIPYDICDRPEEAVPFINRIIDRSHIRGDIAGIFVEGGAATCSVVSNMAGDELYEGVRLPSEVEKR